MRVVPEVNEAVVLSHQVDTETSGDYEQDVG